MEMKIVLIDPYTDIPENDSARKSRMHCFADNLISNLFKIEVFVSSFSHIKKSKVQTKIYRNNSNLKFIAVSSFSYFSHLSYKRVLSEMLFGIIVSWKLLFSKKPFFAILRDPAIFYSPPILLVLFLRRIKYSVDIIDLWPEIFQGRIHTKFRIVEEVLLQPLFFYRSLLFRNAVFLTAVTPDYLEIGLQSKKNKFGDTIFWGCDIKRVDSLLVQKDNIISEMQNFDMSISEEGWLKIVYAGTLGENYDIELILLIAQKLVDHKIKFYIAGNGPKSEIIVKTINDNKLINVVFLGQITENQVYHLFVNCDVGLVPYKKASLISMPIKAYDYMVTGLAMVNSLNNSHLHLLIDQHKIGINVKSGDVESYCEAVLMLYRNRDLLLRMKKNCRELVPLFDTTKQYSKITNLIEEHVLIK